MVSGFGLGQVSRRLMLAAVVACVASAASAQGLFGSLFGPAPGRMEAFCAGDRTVRVERFDPPGCCRYPALIVLHGSDGADERGDQYRLAANEAVKRGYVVFLLRYFEATGTCPNDPTIANMGTPCFKTWVAITRSAVSYASAQPNVDPNRIGVVGFSLGSFVGLSAASTDHRIKAVVDMFGGIPDAYAAKAKALPPTAIFHGQCDDKVSVCESHKLAARLRALGAPCAMYVYPCQGHIFDKASSADASERAFCFLAQYL